MKFLLYTALLISILIIIPLWYFSENNAEGDYWADAGIVKLSGGKSVPAVDFTLETLDGKKISLKDFKGKVVFLNFWATWCPPCRAEMPSLEVINKMFKDKGLVILAIDYGEDAAKVEKFINKYAYTFSVVLDKKFLVSSIYKPRGLPTTYFIDRKGMLVGRLDGPTVWDSKESIKVINEMLKQ